MTISYHPIDPPNHGPFDLELRRVVTNPHRRPDGTYVPRGYYLLKLFGKVLREASPQGYSGLLSDAFLCLEFSKRVGVSLSHQFDFRTARELEPYFIEAYASLIGPKAPELHAMGWTQTFSLLADLQCGKITKDELAIKLHRPAPNHPI